MAALSYVTATCEWQKSDQLFQIVYIEHFTYYFKFPFGLEYLCVAFLLATTIYISDMRALANVRCRHKFSLHGPECANIIDQLKTELGCGRRRRRQRQKRKSKICNLLTEVTIAIIGSNH